MVWDSLSPNGKLCTKRLRTRAMQGTREGTAPAAEQEIFDCGFCVS